MNSILHSVFDIPILLWQEAHLYHTLVLVTNRWSWLRQPRREKSACVWPWHSSSPRGKSAKKRWLYQQSNKCKKFLLTQGNVIQQVYNTYLLGDFYMLNPEGGMGTQFPPSQNLQSCGQTGSSLSRNNKTWVVLWISRWYRALGWDTNIWWGGGEETPLLCFPCHWWVGGWKSVFLEALLVQGDRRRCDHTVPGRLRLSQCRAHGRCSVSAHGVNADLHQLVTVIQLDLTPK